MVIPALMSREVNIYASTASDYRRLIEPILVKTGQVIGLWHWPLMDEEGSLQRNPLIPELPSISDRFGIIHGGKPSGRIWEALKLVMKFSSIDHVVLGPPAMNERATAALRQGFTDTSNSGAFIADFERAFTFAPLPVSHKAIRKKADGLANIDPGMAKFLRAFIASGAGTGSGKGGKKKR